MHKLRVLHLQMGCGESLTAIALQMTPCKKNKQENNGKLSVQNRNKTGETNREIN